MSASAHKPRQNRRSVAIGPIGGVGVAFRRIDRGIGGGVDHHSRGGGLEGGLDRLRPVEIEVGAADAEDSAVARQGRGKLAGAAGDQDGPGGHRRIAPSAGKGGDGRTKPVRP